MCAVSPDQQLLSLLESFMKRTVFFIAFALSLVTLSACNTMHGFGQDLEKAGETISGAAKK
jgi:predicted small secreted protein